MKISISSLVKRLHEAEVEERHVAAGLEQVVARVRVAVEGPQPVEAAEHEAEDRLGRQVALFLTPLEQLGPAGTGGEFGGEHPFGRVLRQHRRAP